MDVREFLTLVGGLSKEARWPRAWGDMPVEAETPEAIAGVLGSFLG